MSNSCDKNMNNGVSSSAADETDNQTNKNGTPVSSGLDLASGDGGDTSQVDTGIFGFGKKVSSRSWNDPSRPAEMPVDVDSDRYNMKHPKRGKCIIINNRDFSPHLDLGSRKGTDTDLYKLKHVFQELKFEVEDHTNVTYRDMCKIVQDAAFADHSSEDSFVLCFLSHGDEGILYATDRSFKMFELWSDFTADKCRTLSGKPKLFFIQACQGENLDHGKTVIGPVSSVDSHTETDCPRVRYTIPTRADFLIAYSTVPGHYSWRNTSQGSWFIQELCNVLKEYHTQKDLLSMMTVVSRKVAIYHEPSCPDNYAMHKKKQIPCISSMLTRDVYF